MPTMAQRLYKQDVHILCSLPCGLCYWKAAFEGSIGPQPQFYLTWYSCTNGACAVSMVLVAIMEASSRQGAILLNCSWLNAGKLDRIGIPTNFQIQAVLSSRYSCICCIRWGLSWKPYSPIPCFPAPLPPQFSHGKHCILCGIGWDWQNGKLGRDKGKYFLLPLGTHVPIKYAGE